MKNSKMKPRKKEVMNEKEEKIHRKNDKKMENNEIKRKRDFVFQFGWMWKLAVR